MDKINYKEAKKILKMNGINIEKKYIKFEKKLINTNEYLSMVCSYGIFNKENICLKNSKINYRISIIYHLFLANVFKFTKFGLILPCFVFLIISLISFSLGLFLQNKGNFGFIEMNEAQLQFLFFIAIFLFAIFLIYLYKILILKQKAFFSKKGGQNRLVYISEKRYIEMLEIFEENIKKDSEKFAVLESNNLKIRCFNEEDKEDVYEFLKNDNFLRYLNMKKALNIDDSCKFIQENLNFYANNLYYKLALVQKDDNKVIGFIGLSKNDYSFNTCQVIYGINEPYWNKGYTSEALKVYVEYLKKIGMKYIFAGHVKENMNSGKVLLKNGFVRYPKKDNIMKIKGENKEIVSYVLECESEIDE